MSQGFDFPERTPNDVSSSTPGFAPPSAPTPWSPLFWIPDSPKIQLFLSVLLLLALYWMLKAVSPAPSTTPPFATVTPSHTSDKRRPKRHQRHVSHNMADVEMTDEEREALLSRRRAAHEREVAANAARQFHHMMSGPRVHSDCLRIYSRIINEAQRQLEYDFRCMCRLRLVTPKVLNEAFQPTYNATRDLPGMVQPDPLQPQRELKVMDNHYEDTEQDTPMPLAGHDDHDAGRDQPVPPADPVEEPQDQHMDFLALEWEHVPPEAPEEIFGVPSSDITGPEETIESPVGDVAVLPTTTQLPEDSLETAVVGTGIPYRGTEESTEEPATDTHIPSTVSWQDSALTMEADIADQKPLPVVETTEISTSPTDQTLTSLLSDAPAPGSPPLLETVVEAPPGEAEPPVTSQDHPFGTAVPEDTLQRYEWLSPLTPILSPAVLPTMAETTGAASEVIGPQHNESQSNESTGNSWLSLTPASPLPMVAPFDMTAGVEVLAGHQVQMDQLNAAPELQNDEPQNDEPQNYDTTMAEDDTESDDSDNLDVNFDRWTVLEHMLDCNTGRTFYGRSMTPIQNAETWHHLLERKPRSWKWAEHFHYYLRLLNVCRIQAWNYPVPRVYFPQSYYDRVNTRMDIDTTDDETDYSSSTVRPEETSGYTPPIKKPNGVSSLTNMVQRRMLQHFVDKPRARPITATQLKRVWILTDQVVHLADKVNGKINELENPDPMTRFTRNSMWASRAMLAPDDDGTFLLRSKGKGSPLRNVISADEEQSEPASDLEMESESEPESGPQAWTKSCNKSDAQMKRKEAREAKSDAEQVYIVGRKKVDPMKRLLESLKKPSIEDD